MKGGRDVFVSYVDGFLRVFGNFVTPSRKRDARKGNNVEKVGGRGQITGGCGYTERKSDDGTTFNRDK
jgi:hypothetical protein